MSDSSPREIFSSASSSSPEFTVNPSSPGISYLPSKFQSPTVAGPTAPEPCKTCRCAVTCSCRHPLEFPRRVAALPPVRAAAALYSRVKATHESVACALTTAEVAALVATAPARLAARSLRGALATPVYVGDLLLCKGLDLAQRVLPCIAQPPEKTCHDLAFYSCALPAGACLLATKTVCRGARFCLCDVPSVILGAPALAACSLTELCVCCAPRAVCCPPAQVYAKAARGALRDANSMLQDFSYAADRCSERMTAQ